MALIQCPSCGNKISDKAIQCPKCSKVLVQQNSEQVTGNLQKEKKSFWIVSIISLFLGLFSLPLGFFVLLSGIWVNPKFQKYLHNKLNINISNSIVIFIYIVLFIVGTLLISYATDNIGKNISTNSVNSNVSNTPNISGTKCTDIKKFDYNIEGNTIKLERYKGWDKTVIISDTYKIDNNDYTVTQLENSIFNSTNVSKIYFPKTITSITDNMLAYLNADHIDIYYEGSEDEWNRIFTIYNATSVTDAYNSGDAASVGKALADKLNAKMGHEYDASKFTYHFNSKIEDI